MGGGQMKTPARGLAQPGQENRYASAAGTFTLAKIDRMRQWLAKLWAALLAFAARIAP